MVKASKNLTFAAVASVCALVLFAAATSTPNGSVFQLFFTGDLYGYLKPCG